LPHQRFASFQVLSARLNPKVSLPVPAILHHDISEPGGLPFKAIPISLPLANRLIVEVDIRSAKPCRKFEQAVLATHGARMNRERRSSLGLRVAVMRFTTKGASTNSGVTRCHDPISSLNESCGKFFDQGQRCSGRKDHAFSRTIAFQARIRRRGQSSSRMSDAQFAIMFTRMEVKKTDREDEGDCPPGRNVVEP